MKVEVSYSNFFKPEKGFNIFNNLPFDVLKIN